MRHPALTLRQAFWIVCACVLLLPLIAAAEPALAIDVDGDGRHDRFMLDGREPSVLLIWLSESDTTQVIRAHAPLLQVIAIDLDGDHRPELVARDGDSRIHVWTRKHNRFHSYRPRHVVPGTVKHRSSRSIEDDDREAPGAIPSTPFPPFALTLCASPCAPRLEASTTCTPQTVSASRWLPAAEPFAPRPPPTSASS